VNRRQAIAADAVGLAALAASLAIAASIVPPGPMTALHWTVAALAAAALSLVLWHHRSGPRSLGGWLWLLGLSVLLAGIFWGANVGLDLIKPPGSRRHDAASTLGGIELWALFCPGLTAVALAGLVRSLALRVAGHAARD
jgi:hypothetical protein